MKNHIYKNQGQVAKTPHILMVTHVKPYPPAAGNEIRIYRMLKWLKGAGFRISLVLRPIDDEEISNDCIEGLNQVVDDLFIFDSRSGKSGILHPPFAQDGAEGRENLVEMQGGFCPYWFVAAVDELIGELAPDALISQYIFMSRILLSQNARHCLKIIDTHDLFSKKHEVVEKYNIENFGLIMTADDEASLFERADVLLAIQQIEFDQINSMVSGKKVLLTGFDVDIGAIRHNFEEKGVVLIVASSNEFNVRGTQDFLDYTWPLLKERYPEASLRLVGKVCEHVYVADSSVQKVGFVRNLSDEYERACVVVNPCGVGTGLKIKTVEALAWGKAHVGWPASADGLREFSDLPYIVAQDAVEFSDAIADLLIDTDKMRKLGKKAHVFAERYFGGGSTYGSLTSLIESHAKALSKLG